LVTTYVDASQKITWFKWWNAKRVVHENLKFPIIEVSNANFTKWLHKVMFWGQVCPSKILHLGRHYEHAMFENLVLGIDIVFDGFC
jgi:hypothetical protein